MTTQQLTEEATSKYVQIKNLNLRIHYNEAGTGDPVIFLHGSGPGASSWSNFFRNVGPISQRYRCILMDQPGWGKSDSVVITADKPRSVVNAQAVVGLMDALGIRKASLIGNSMGGATALNVAVDYPDRVDKLVLMGSGAGGPTLFGHQPSEGLKVLYELYEKPSVEGLRRLINVMLYDGAQVPDEILRQRYTTIQENPKHIESWLKSSRATRSILNEVQQVQHQTLIIHGRNDRVVPLEGSMWLLSAMPNAQLHVFNKCGHWAQFEHADEFNELVLNFLNRKF